MAPAEPPLPPQPAPASETISAVNAGAIAVSVALAHRPGEVALLALTLPAGASAAEALRAAHVLQRLGAEQLDGLTLGLWGRACSPHTVLHDGDRLELTRGLRVDPKEARRLRYRRDGLRPQRKLRVRPAVGASQACAEPAPPDSPMPDDQTPGRG